MKRIFIVILTFIISISAVACANGTGETTASGTIAVTPTAPAVTAPVIAKWDNSTVGYGYEDLTILINNTVYGLKKDVIYVLNELGKAYDVKEAISCYFEGEMEREYEYSDLKLSTYPINNKDIINNILISSDKYSTWKGVKVGDNLDKIVSVYGEDYSEQTDNGRWIVYYIDSSNGDENSPKLTFVMEGDVITEIVIFAAITPTTTID